MNLPDCLHLGELTEYESDGLLDAPIRVLLDPVVVRGLRVTHCHVEEELAALRLLLQRLQ